MPTDVLMVRHGQSTWNALGRWQGQANPPLSPLGERQAKAAAERLHATFDAVISSDLERAFRTAELASGVDVTADVAFRERNAGEWQGLTRVDLNERWPDWQTTGWRPEGFESDVEVLARVLPRLDEIVQQYAGRTLLIVTHGGVVRAMDRHLDAGDVAIPNLAGRWYHHDHDGWCLGEYVELAADVTDSDVE